MPHRKVISAGAHGANHGGFFCLLHQSRSYCKSWQGDSPLGINLEPKTADAAISLKGKAGTLDIGIVDLVAAFDLASKTDGFSKTAYAAIGMGSHEHHHTPHRL